MVKSFDARTKESESLTNKLEVKNALALWEN